MPCQALPAAALAPVASAAAGSAAAAETTAGVERAPSLRTLLRPCNPVGTLTIFLERVAGPTAMRRPRKLARAHAVVHDNEHAAIVLDGSGCLPRLRARHSGCSVTAGHGWEVSTCQDDTCQSKRSTDSTDD